MPTGVVTFQTSAPLAVAYSGSAVSTSDLRFDGSGRTMFVEAGAELAVHQRVVVLRHLLAERDPLYLKESPAMNAGGTVAQPA